MKQGEEKPVAQFTTRLKQKAQQCNFVDNNREIKNQIVFNQHSDHLQRKSLRDDLDLKNLVAAARAIELSTKQATLMEEKDQEDLYCFPKTVKYSNKCDKNKWNKKETDNNKKCCACGNSWSHKKSKSSCPAC